MRWLIVVMIVLAGCVSPEPEPTETDDQETPADPLESYWITLNLTADGRLSNESVAPAIIPLNWGYTDWLDGTPPPAWSGESISNPFVVLEGSVVLNFASTQAQSGANVRPELTAWWGSDFGISHHLFFDGPDVIMANEPVRGEAELRVPAGGFVYSEGRSVFLSVGSYYLDGLVAPTMELHVGGDDPSRLELLVMPLEIPAKMNITTSEIGLGVQGSRCTVDTAEYTSATTMYQVQGGTGGFRATAVQAGAGPTPDIDMVILAADGTVVGRSQSSLGIEGAEVWPINMEAGGGPYDILVYACTFQSSTVTISVESWQ